VEHKECYIVHMRQVVQYSFHISSQSHFLIWRPLLFFRVFHMSFLLFGVWLLFLDFVIMLSFVVWFSSWYDWHIVNDLLNQQIDYHMVDNITDRTQTMEKNWWGHLLNDFSYIYILNTDCNMPDIWIIVI